MNGDWAYEADSDGNAAWVSNASEMLLRAGAVRCAAGTGRSIPWGRRYAAWSPHVLSHSFTPQTFCDTSPKLHNTRPRHDNTICSLMLKKPVVADTPFVFPHALITER